MTPEQKLKSGVEALSREAFLRALEEHNPDKKTLEKNVEKCLLSGIATGELNGISEDEFETRIDELFDTNYESLDNTLGLGWTRANPAKMTEAQIRASIRYNSNRKCKSKKCEKHRLADLNALRAYMTAQEVARSKSLHNRYKKKRKSGISGIIKGTTDTVVKTVKKVAPIAAAGAALYYGAPYLMKGGKALITGAKKIFGSDVNKAVAEGQQIPGGDLQNAAIKKATGLASQLLQKQGVKMQSPQSQQLLREYMENETRQVMPPPGQMVVPQGGRYQPVKEKKGLDLAKLAIPAAAVGAALLLT